MLHMSTVDILTASCVPTSRETLSAAEAERVFRGKVEPAAT
jgi:hypothetical protein